MGGGSANGASGSGMIGFGTANIGLSTMQQTANSAFNQNNQFLLNRFMQPTLDESDLAQLDRNRAERYKYSSLWIIFRFKIGLKFLFQSHQLQIAIRTGIIVVYAVADWRRRRERWRAKQCIGRPNRWHSQCFVEHNVMRFDYADRTATWLRWGKEEARSPKNGGIGLASQRLWFALAKRSTTATAATATATARHQTENGEQITATTIEAGTRKEQRHAKRHQVVIQNDGKTGNLYIKSHKSTHNLKQMKTTKNK